jgi:hypothetical protein
MGCRASLFRRNNRHWGSTQAPDRKRRHLCHTPGFNILKNIPLLALLLVLACRIAQATGPVALSSGPISTQRLSIIEIPVTIPLSPLFREMEALTPRQAGHWGGWQSHKGIETQYRAWRGPLMIRAAGDTLLVQAHVRYWVKARASLLGAVTVSGSCGVDEPPRQAVIGVAVRLAWGPDWSLHPRFRVLPTRFFDACEMTVAAVDVTPIVDRAFDRQLRRSILQALQARRTELGELQRQAIRVWGRLQEPVEVASGVWLSLHPVGAAAAAPEGRGDEVLARLGVALRPTFHYGERPAATATPLPPLGQLPPGDRGLLLDLSLSVNWEALSGLVSSALQGRIFELNGRRLQIAAVELSGRGAEVQARIRLEGEGSGEVELWAEPVLGQGTPALRLANLGYLYHADDPLTEVVAESFYEQVRVALMEAVNGLIARRLDRLQAALRDRFQTLMPDSTTLDVGSLSLTGGTIRVSDAGVAVSATASGELRLDID